MISHNSPKMFSSIFSFSRSNLSNYLFIIKYLFIYDQRNNLNLCDKIGSCQYNTAVAITGAIRGSSK